MQKAACSADHSAVTRVASTAGSMAVMWASSWAVVRVDPTAGSMAEPMAASTAVRSE